MKKLFYLLGILTICLIPSVVNAETFSYNGVNYVLEESNYSCSLNENAIFEQKLNDYYVFHGDDDVLGYAKYKVDRNNVCTLFEGQDYLDYIEKEVYSFLLTDNKIYKYWVNSPSHSYFKTIDTSLNSEKTYYKIGLDSDNYVQFVSIDNPVENNLNTYYEKGYFIHPISSKLDNNVVYYKMVIGANFIPTYFEEVKNPIEDDITNYFIKYDGDFGEPQLVLTVDQTIIDNIKNDNNVLIVMGENDKYFISGRDRYGEPTICQTYDLNGNLIDSLENAVDIAVVGQNLLLVNYLNGTIKIMTFDYEVLYTFENYDSMYLAQSIDNNSFINSFTNDDNKFVLFNLITYKENNKTTHIFNGNDLLFTFSGELAKLSKVKINNEELGIDKYTKASGSTIITLKKDYLKTLTKGNYTLKVEYTDGGDASAVFTIPEENPPTYDGIINYILFGGISIIGIVGCIIYLKKRIKLN